MNNSDHIEALENALREIAFYLGVGGYNDVNVIPENYKSKILWGIDNLVDTAEKIGYNKGQSKILSNNGGHEGIKEPMEGRIDIRDVHLERTS